jgi:hypothetical protein
MEPDSIEIIEIKAGGLHKGYLPLDTPISN